jgi:hypothetical protein
LAPRQGAASWKKALLHSGNVQQRQRCLKKTQGNAIAKRMATSNSRLLRCKHNGEEADKGSRGEIAKRAEPDGRTLDACTKILLGWK